MDCQYIVLTAENASIFNGRAGVTQRDAPRRSRKAAP
jgi:hypothetical protein